MSGTRYRPWQSRAWLFRLLRPGLALGSADEADSADEQSGRARSFDEQLEQIVERALAELPPEFRSRIENAAFVIGISDSRLREIDRYRTARLAVD